MRWLRNRRALLIGVRPEVASGSSFLFDRCSEGTRTSSNPPVSYVRFSSLILGVPKPVPINRFRRSRPESFRPLATLNSRCVPALRARSGHGRWSPGARRLLASNRGRLAGTTRLRRSGHAAVHGGDPHPGCRCPAGSAAPARRGGAPRDAVATAPPARSTAPGIEWVRPYRGGRVRLADLSSSGPFRDSLAIQRRSRYRASGSPTLSLSLRADRPPIQRKVEGG